MASSLGAVGLLQTLPATEYVWPSKYDNLEDILNLQSGYLRQGFMDGVTPCSFSSAGAGRQTAAEWIRTAYHDMSTYDAATGTGGLDASIMFETQRDENEGSAFNGTFGFTNGYYSVKASQADLIALSVVIASKACGGPDIPFRAGRVDATEAGPTGVPKPDQDIDTHTQIFAKAGFNTSDMIAMVACGHTLGGIHGTDFPEITGNESATNFEHFEIGDSFSKFDNAIVTEYLESNTSNLLVVGKNDTLNSDKRVFNADGNVTMNALADPTTFRDRCADIFTRMIDTVPASVNLSEAITTIDIKPYQVGLTLNSNGSLDFTGQIRVRTTERNNSDLAVHLTYADRSGVNNTAHTIATKRPTYLLGATTGFGETFTWYQWQTSLPVNSSISKFNVHLTTPSTGAMTVHDNAGHGFPISDAILYQSAQSCLYLQANADKTGNLTVVAAVRKDRAAEPVTLSFVTEVPRQGVAVRQLRVDNTPMEKVDGGERGEYVLFKVDRRTSPESSSTSFDVSVGEGDDEVKVEFQKTGPLTTTCKPL